MAKILLIEDDPLLRDILQYNLEQEGYAVETAADGLDGLNLGFACAPDLILLDIMLPRLDGFAVCRILHQAIAAPIIMLTARHAECDRLAAFDLGADDYVVKPFSRAELLARIRVALRRSSPADNGERRELLRAGELQVEPGSRRATRGDRELELSQKEFDLLVCLMRNQGKALSRDLLLEHVWGHSSPADSRTIDVHIHWLREKIEANPSRPALIRTVRGIGYRFEVPSSLTPMAH